MNMPTGRPADLGAILEGTNLGHFYLEQFVGGGGMGAVFRANDRSLGRTVAVKVLLRDRTDDETLKRFQNEAQSAARLDHENIARVYYVGEDKGYHFIVFEFIEGINVRDLVDQKGALPLNECIGYVLQICEALEHASKRDVVHRDIKPSNILVTPEGRAKLVDMGLARLHHMESRSNDLTASGVTLGTFDYISPEQARDPRFADVRSDLYSLGCTFYYMLTGRPPFPDGTVLQKLLSHSSEEPSDPRTVRPDLDEQVVKIITQLLAKAPEERFQHPSELIVELLAVADRLNLNGIAASGSYWTAPQPSRLAVLGRHLPWLLPVFLLFAVVFIAEQWLPGTDDIYVPDAPPKLSPLQNTATDSSANEATGVSSDEIEAREPLQDSPEQQTSPSGSVAPDESGNAPPLTDAPTASSSDTTEVADLTPSPMEEAADAMENDSTAAQPDAIAIAGATPESPSVDSPPPMILVADAGTSLAENEFPVASTLQSACRMASRTGVEVIQLCFDGERFEMPFDVDAERLTIARHPNFSPTIVFRPSFEDLDIDRRMIRVARGTLHWQGVHIRLELPREAPQDWTLFSLQGAETLDLRDTVLTIRNRDADGRLLQSQASFFHLAPPSSVSSSGPTSGDSRSFPPCIRLNNCIVRGQADVVFCPEALPFSFFCDQTLIVTRKRLLDIHGTRTRPGTKEGRVDVVMNNVTALLGEGLARLETTPVWPYQFDFVRTCNNSILYLPNEQTPQIERKGVSSAQEFEEQLLIKGHDNFYPGSTILLRLNPTGDWSDYVDYDLDRRTESWFQEESPRSMFVLESLPPLDLLEDRHTPDSYWLDESENNPALDDGAGTRAGADLGNLPPTPEQSHTAPLSTQPAP